MSKGKSHISSKKSNRCDFLFKFVNRNQPGLSMKWETQCAHRSVRTSAPPCTGIFAFLHFALLRRHFCISALCIVAQDFLNFCIFALCIVAQEFLHFLHFVLLLRYFCTWSLAQKWFFSQQGCFLPLPKLESYEQIAFTILVVFLITLPPTS